MLHMPVLFNAGQAHSERNIEGEEKKDGKIESMRPMRQTRNNRKMVKRRDDVYGKV